MDNAREEFFKRFANTEFYIKFYDWKNVKAFQKELAEYLPNLRDGDSNRGGYGRYYAKDNNYYNLCWKEETEFHIINNELWYTGIDTSEDKNTPTVMYDAKPEWMLRKPKYKPGEQIWLLETLLKQERIFFRGQLVHAGWFMNWQLQFIMFKLKQGSFYFAVKEEEKKEERDGI